MATANNPVGWFEIYVQDMKRARKFYESVFQIKLEQIKTTGIELWVFPMSQEGKGASGALAHMEGFEPGGNSTIVYFSSPDCAIEEKRAVAAGGRVQKEKSSIGEYGFITLVWDTEGNIIGIHSRK